MKQRSLIEFQSFWQKILNKKNVEHYIEVVLRIKIKQANKNSNTNRNTMQQIYRSFNFFYAAYKKI